MKQTSRRWSPLAVLAALAIVAASAGLGAQAKPEQIFEAAGLKPGHTACEIGAGAGDLTFAAARLVGVEGRVFSNELKQWIRTLQVRAADTGLTNITVILTEPTKTGFPDAACDAVIMKDVYHHFTEPAAMNRAIAAALKPGGRLVIVDFEPPPGKEAATPAGRGVDGSHGVLPATIVREVKEAGLTELPGGSGVDRWFMLVFIRKVT
jgi:ubiquinone/menaquinone biosynthesis C-methylase UbiE